MFFPSCWGAALQTRLSKGNINMSKFTQDSCSSAVWWLTTLFLIMEDSKFHQNMRSPDVSGRYNPCESYPFPWEDKIGIRRQPTAPQTNRTGTFYKCGIICAVMNCGQWGCSSRWVLKLIKTQCWSMLILTSLQLFKRKNSCSVPCLVPYVALKLKIS